MKKLSIWLSVLAITFVAPVALTVFKSLPQYTNFFIRDYTAMRYFWNSALYATIIMVFCVLLSFPMGFFFAKVKFRGRDALFFAYIVVMLLPFQATLLPNFIQLRDFGLLNTPYALILPMLFSPFAVFLFRQFIVGIPNELLEYATLETSSVLQILRYAVIPQLKSAFVALSVIIFCESWNMVEQAIIFTPESPDILPLSVVLTLLPQDVQYAGATVYMYPVLIVFILFGKTLEKGVEKYRW
ncbi:hypothetical protein FACS1894202_13220 [Clostridia bacterium]|nr:hypothetical protein FACS1894202_13220 [Clostridia bacterium]